MCLRNFGKFLQNFLFVSGGEGKVKQYFNGYLAGLSILKGKTESHRVIKCLNNCKEKLDFQAVDKMDTGMVSTIPR